MTDQAAIDDWFCREVLPLEPGLMRYIRRNWRVPEDVFDLTHDIYALALHGVRNGLPEHTSGYVFAIARNHLIQQARRCQIVSIEFMANLDGVGPPPDLSTTDRHIDARDELRRALAGLSILPPRCREVVQLRKVEGLTTRETAERLGVGVDAIEQQLTKGMRALTDFMLGGSGKIAWPSRDKRKARRSE
jgi:RNA polymerase sigma-70 factor (ECF subfamily)